MTKIVPYDSRYLDDLAKLIEKFYQEALNDYGQTMDQMSLEHFEESLGSSSFVMLHDDKVIGIMAGQVVTQLMSQKLIYQEIVWYVDKEYRSRGTALMQHLETWCHENGIDQIVMALMCNSKADRLLAFYKRLGYRPMEMHLIKDIGDKSCQNQQKT